MMKKHQEILPGTNLAKVTDATIKIQSAFRGHKSRKQVKENLNNEELPDLNAADVAAAAIKGSV